MACGANEQPENACFERVYNHDGDKLSPSKAGVQPAGQSKLSQAAFIHDRDRHPIRAMLNRLFAFLFKRRASVRAAAEKHDLQRLDELAPIKETTPALAPTSDAVRPGDRAAREPITR